MFSKIATRILAIILLLVLFNFIYEKWFYEHDLQEHADIINLVREVPKNADILYVGESSNITSRIDDTDKRPISAFIGDYYPSLITVDMTKLASHAEIYKVLLENIPESHQLKTVIVTLNLRSFNAQWIYSNLETALQKSIVLIRDNPPLFNRFMLSFKAYDIKSKEEREEQIKHQWQKDHFELPFDFPFNNIIEWDTWMRRNGIKNELGEIDQEKTVLACHYIKTYGFQLDTINNPRIKDFNDIVKLARQRNWNLVFNLLAENTEKAEELVGKELLYLMNDNARKLETYFTNRGVVVVNNLHAVSDEQYIDRNWTTEHYAENGRRIIARNVAESLKVWHANYFQEIQSAENNEH